MAVLAAAPPASGGELLPNGITLPSSWPPKGGFVDASRVSPAYLESPPSVIPIDVGRQLFVDDFLVQESTLERVFHLPEPYSGNPVFKAQQPWERSNKGKFAAPFSDGIWWDPEDQQIKMWYMCGYTNYTGYATSQDGIRWERPTVAGAIRGNALKILPAERDSSCIWLDLESTDPNQRFKMTFTRTGIRTRWSRDGITWNHGVDIGDLGTEAPGIPNHPDQSIPYGDRSTFFYNPFRKVWVYSIRDSGSPHGRRRLYAESPLFDITRLQASDVVPWICADKLDAIRPEAKGKRVELYNLDVMPYESLLLGQFVILSANADEEKKRPKLNHVTAGYSRDGFYWHRPDRRAFLPLSDRPDAWNYGNVQSTTALLVMGDKLYFYASGRTGSPAKHGFAVDAGASTGLFTLRRDGFASLEGSGTLTTRPVSFQGRHLFVNVDCPAGELRVEALNEDGSVISPFTRENCRPVSADSTIQAVRWKDGNLSGLAGKPVRFRFHLKDGKLFSFWVSPDASGASHGYIGTGGPGFTSHRDTVGTTAYDRNALAE